MNVTCERCNTEYDFDDTLVSGRGTTVKCTNCGHLFKVRKKSGDPAAAPEKWIVRTVDGRELQFNALRELQAAITQRTIGREDVLSRGSSRPRRLGAITELEPFFTGTAGAPHTTTAPGIGGANLGSSALGVSAMGTAAIGLATPAATPPARGKTTPQGGTPSVTLPSANVDDPVMDSSDMQEDQTVVRPNPIEQPAPAPAGHMFPPPARPGDKAAAKQAAKEASPPPVRTPTTKEQSPAPAKLPEKPPPTRTPTPSKGVPAQHAEPPARPPEKAAARPPTKEAAKEKEISPPNARLPEKPATQKSAKEKEPVAPPTRSAEKAPTRTAKDARSTSGTSTEADSKSEASATPPTLPAQREQGAAPTRKQQLPIGVPAKDVKISHMEEEPRFSTAKPSKKGSSGAQRIIAFVAAGVLIFVGVTAGRRFFVKPTVPTAPTNAPDERIPGFLAAAEKSLNEGDFQEAQSQLDKASALNEKDPKVAAELARLAAVRSDTKWLHVRLLPMGDPEQALIQKELDATLERARKAVEHAQTVAANDPSVTRRRIDVLRMSGKLEEARKLVASLPGAGAQPESALVLAALDLAEEKPSWPSVIERLRTAVVGEQSIGRARSMLIYALVRSGDVAGAKAEYDQLAGMPRPHPLLPPLRELIARAEGAVADAGADAGELSIEDSIRLANETRAKGDPKRAEEIFKEVLKKSPTNADAEAGLGDIARARGDRATAIRYYELALKHNAVHLPALTALADLKWDNPSERQAALPLYRRIVDNAPSSAFAAHARARLGGPIPEDTYIQTPPPPTYTAPPPPTYTAPPPPTPTYTAPPPPTVTTPPPPTVTTPPPPPSNTNAPPIDFEGQ